jgi:hypothetical protein
MKLIGFSFKKISIEKFGDQPESIKFDTKLDISSIDSLRSDILKTREELVKVDFLYTTLFDPNFAKIDLAGQVILSVDPKIARDVLKNWKDKQQPSEDFRTTLFNIILRKATIKALELGEEMGLPPHIPLPFLNKDSLKEKKQD